MADYSTMRSGSDVFGPCGEARLSRRACLLALAAAASVWPFGASAYAHGNARMLIAENGFQLASETGEALEG